MRLSEQIKLEDKLVNRSSFEIKIFIFSVCDEDVSVHEGPLNQL